MTHAEWIKDLVHRLEVMGIGQDVAINGSDAVDYLNALLNDARVQLTHGEQS